MTTNVAPSDSKRASGPTSVPSRLTSLESELFNNQNSYAMEQFAQYDTSYPQHSHRQNTPLTPYGTNNQRSSNHQQLNYNMFGHQRDLPISSSSQYFSPPMNTYGSTYPKVQRNAHNMIPILFSPDDMSSRLIHDDLPILNPMAGYQFANDFDNLDNVDSPIPPNSGHINHNGYNQYNTSSYNNPSLYQKGGYLSNNQFNVPMNQLSTSPHLSHRSGGGNPIPRSLNSNNLFNQHATNANYRPASQQYAYYQNGQSPYINGEANNDLEEIDQGIAPNDLFDDLDIQDWMQVKEENSVPTNTGNKENDDEDDDEDEEEMINDRTRKQFKKNETTCQSREVHSDDRDVATTTTSSSSSSNSSSNSNSNSNSNSSGGADCYRKKDTKTHNNSRILNSSEKTLKQYYISPKNSEKFSRNAITPIKSVSQHTVPIADTQQCYMTPTALPYRTGVKQEEGNDDIQVANYQNNAGNQREDKGQAGRNGLRILSKKVREIVCELKETTYKQVAEYLIKEIEATKQSSLEFAKDEQNVKRRVYDALNVLIAANVLTKDGKKVKAEQIIPKENPPQSQNPLQKREYLEKALVSKRARLQRKQETINDFIMKYVSLKSICERNATTEKNRQKVPFTNTSISSIKCLTLQESPNSILQTISSESSEDQKKLRFPFIGVYSPSNNSRISFKKYNHGLSICSVQQLNISGDIDILVKLYSHRSPEIYRLDKMKYLSDGLLGFLYEMQCFLEEPNLTEEGESGNQQHDEEEDGNSFQMEVTVTNNRHIEKKSMPVQQSQQKTQTLSTRLRPVYDEEDEGRSKHSNKYVQSYHSKKMNPHDLEAKQETSQTRWNLNAGVEHLEEEEGGEQDEYFQDSNQLVNDYIN